MSFTDRQILLAISPFPCHRCTMPDGVYNGSQCSPAKRKAIVEGVLNHEPVNAIAERVHASTGTVAVVRDQELPEWRKHQCSNFKQYASNVTRSLLDMTPADLAKASLYERTVSLGIVIDKILTLEGEPTQIVEHRHTIDMSGMLPPEIVVSEHNPDTTKAITGPDSLTIPEKTQG